MAISKKEDIISYLYNDLKPINIEGTAYNNIMIYSYFHNDIVKDMRLLYENYKEMYTAYMSLYNGYRELKQWYDDFYNVFNNLYNNHYLYLHTNGTNVDTNNTYRGQSISSQIGALPHPLPTVTQLSNAYENYTYTWDKNWTTYHKPYNTTNYKIKEKISYSYLQDYGTTITYSYLKFCNNRYENHMPLIL